MNEKYFLALGAGLIIISFGIVVSFAIFSHVDLVVTVENETIRFEQLREVHSEAKEAILNSTVVEEVRLRVNETMTDLKLKISDQVNQTGDFNLTK